MKKKHALVAFLFFTACLRFLGQPLNQTQKWYFGFYAGLDFATTPPTALADTTIIALEGSASIADNQGNLLFYTNGLTIWNQTHTPMANGTNLLGGNQSSTQGSLILQQPGSANLYYVFTADQQAGPNGLCYSIVDMSLAAGMGSVTVKNVQLQTPCGEKLTAVKHCNGVDVWVISHDWNSADFRAYLLTTTGLVNAPVISTIGSVHAFNLYNIVGYMKASPNGQKLGLGIYGLNRYELFDFDNSTGIVTNSLVLNASKPYGCEFSPDSKKFYGGTDEEDGNDNLFQWDLSSGLDSMIIASRVALSNTIQRKGAIQAAPDGKLYVARLFQYHLGVINNPNLTGTSCNYTDLGVLLPGLASSWAGLPNFMSSYFNTSTVSCSINYSISSNCSTVSFSSYKCATDSANNGSMRWMFGDPDSGMNNTSQLYTPVHNYPGNGSYLVRLVCGSDTLSRLIQINCESLGIADRTSGVAFSLFPNPAKETINIRFDKTPHATYHLKLSNTLGKIAHSRFDLKPEERLSLEQLSPGVYFLQLFDGNRMIAIEKIVKE